MTKLKVPKHYIPNKLSKKDKIKQKRELIKSRKLYKKGKYYKRKKVKSFKSKLSPHIVKAQKMFKVNSIKADNTLSKATKCSILGLKKIIKKGEGAYYSSGSRPNQSAESWGRARLASALTGGPSSKVDYHLLRQYCKKNSKSLKLAIVPKKYKLNKPKK
jgi:hypothetical protein